MRSPVRILIAALLAGIGLLTLDPSRAQPHMQPTLDDVTVPTPPQDVWLRRLVGRFELGGMIQTGICQKDGADNCATIKGKMDCVAIGRGPGVQCIVNATWRLYSGTQDLDSFLDPAMSLFGMDPGRNTINLLLVNDQSLASGGSGVIKGHTTLFRMCRGEFEDGCPIGIIIEAKPDAGINYMWIGTNIVISMRRVREDFTPLEKSSR